DQQDLIFLGHHGHAGDLAVALAGLDVDHADAAAVLRRILRHRRALAVALFRDREDVDAAAVVRDLVGFVALGLAVVLFDDRASRKDIHLHDVVVIAQRHGADAGGATAHGADLVFVEADHAAAGLADEDVGVAVGEAHGVEVVALGDVDGD